MSKVEKQLQGLDSALSEIGKYSGLAFAGLTAAVGVSVYAFNEADKINRQVSQSLQQQGIYTDQLSQQYNSIADAVERKNGADASQLKSGMALAQGFLQETEITEELATAVTDLATAKGMDLKAAFEVVSKSIGTNTNALSKYGVEIDSSASKSEKMQAVIDQLNSRFGGQAQAAADSTNIMIKQFGKVTEEFGSRFAPAVNFAADKLASFFDFMSKNKVIMDVAFALTAAGIAVTGITTVVAAAGLAWIKYKAIMEAAGLATKAMTIASRALTAATGLGLIITAVTLIYMNWSTIWPRMQIVFKAFVDFVINVATGVKDVLMGLITLDPERIKQGLVGVKDAYVQGFKDVTQSLPEIKAPEVEQDPELKRQADERRRIEEDEAARRIRREDAERELRIMKAREGSKAMIDLKSQEVDLLKQLEDKQNADIAGVLQGRLDLVREKMIEQAAMEQEQRQIINDQLLVDNEAFQALSQEQKERFYQESVSSEMSRVLTESEAAKAAAAEKLKGQIDANNRFLMEQQKFGKAYATINSVINNEAVKGFADAGRDLIQLQSSNNSTLKSAGRVFALSDIAMRTATSAMRIYEGFSTIPIIGPALGIAGAAAAIAFGGEQAGKVVKANKGGVIPGAGPDRDSVLSYLTPGETVVPRRSFDEVVEGTARQRGFVSGDDQGETNRLLQGIQSGISNLGEALGLRSDPREVQPEEFFNWLCAGIYDATKNRGARVI